MTDPNDKRLRIVAPTLSMNYPMVLNIVRLLDDILDISKIEAGKVDVEHIDFDLHALLAEQTSLFDAVARCKAVVLVHHVAPSWVATPAVPPAGAAAV